MSPDPDAWLERLAGATTAVESVLAARRADPSIPFDPTLPDVVGLAALFAPGELPEGLPEATRARVDDLLSRLLRAREVLAGQRDALREALLALPAPGGVRGYDQASRGELFDAKA